ncbi:hypothetical protein LINPERHAP1_LOCUS17763 [Linum perenne]
MNNDAYTPHIVSVGPLIHHKEKSLKGMEARNASYGKPAEQPPPASPNSEILFIVFQFIHYTATLKEDGIEFEKDETRSIANEIEFKKVRERRDRRQRIIDNDLGGREDVAAMFNNIYKKIVLRDFYFAGVCEQVNKYYHQWWNRYKSINEEKQKKKKKMGRRRSLVSNTWKFCMMWRADRASFNGRGTENGTEGGQIHRILGQI